MAKSKLSPELIDLVADRFRALAEPARILVLQELQAGERTVGELADATGLSTANISKHLQLLHSAGFVDRRKEGLYVYYCLADADVVQLCEIMCGRLDAESRKREQLLSARAS